MLEQFRRAEARVVGVVFNRIPRDRNSYYGGYKYYSPYHKNKYNYYRDDHIEPEKAPVKQK
jgi:Mrp family chromosome partitioning ATPase